MTASVLSLYLKLLERNGYFSIKYNSNSVRRFEYGPFGTYLKENIFKEWKRSVLSSKEINVFPVSYPAGDPTSNTIQRMEELTEQYVSVLKMRNFKYPFGVASWKTLQNPCVDRNHQETKDHLVKELWKPSDWTFLTTIHFCPLDESVYWFDRLHRLRLRWWRNLSQKPSTFSFIEVPQSNSSNLSEVQIMFYYDQQILPVESIINVGPWAINLPGGTSKNHTPCAIVCESNLDRSALTYLLDAYHETSQGRKLCLNNLLVPYKIVLAYRNSSDRNLKEMSHLENYIATELQKVGLTIFPNPHLEALLDIKKQFSWFDELGIPYVIVLESSTLTNGIVYVRNKDTTLEEQLHLSEVQAVLLEYCNS